MATEQDLRREIVDVCHRLRRAALVVALEGNVSCRYVLPGGDAAVLATPTAHDKGLLRPDDLARTDMEGSPRWGGPRPSTELPAHLAVYRARPDVCGIVHAHPPYATSFAVAGIALDQPLLAEAVVDLGAVPVAPYSTPGRTELADAIAALAARHDVILMANHGAICLGRSVTEAFHRMETLEHVALIALLTRILGRSRALSPGDVAELVKGKSAPVCATCARVVDDAAAAAADDGGRYVLSRGELVDLITEAVRSVGGGM